MELFIIFISAVVIGFAWGWRTASRMHMQGFSHILKSLNISNDELIRSIRKTAGPELLAQLDLIEQQAQTEIHTEAVVEVKLEQHGSQIYAYRKDTDQFLGQGTDRDSLIARLNQTMRPCRVLIAKEDGAELLSKSHT